MLFSQGDDVISEVFAHVKHLLFLAALLYLILSLLSVKQACQSRNFSLRMGTKYIFAAPPYKNYDNFSRMKTYLSSTVSWGTKPNSRRKFCVVV